MKGEAEKFTLRCADCAYRRAFATNAATVGAMDRHRERTGGHQMTITHPRHYKRTIAKVSRRKKMRAQRVTGKLPGKRLARPRGWSAAVDRTHCICCHAITMRAVHHKPHPVPCGVVDHLFPERWVRAHGLDPHNAANLNSVCAARCHGRKLKFEHYLYAGNLIGFVRGLREMNFPIDRVRAAFTYYGVATTMLTEGL